MILSNQELEELRVRLSSMISDISQDALPNPGEEKIQWMSDIYECREIIEDYLATS